MSLQQKGTTFSLADFVLFNNLEISDVLTGSIFMIDSIQVSHLHVA